MNVTLGGIVTKKTLIGVVHIETDHLTLAGPKVCLECPDTITVLPWVCLTAILFLLRQCNKLQICIFRLLHRLVMSMALLLPMVKGNSTLLTDTPIHLDQCLLLSQVLTSNICLVEVEVLTQTI